MMNEEARQAGIQNIRSIRDELKRQVPGARAYHSREEKAMQFMIAELAAVLQANQSAYDVLTQLSSGLDPFSPEFDQAAAATAMIKTARDRAGQTLHALEHQYQIPKQGAAL